VLKQKTSMLTTSDCGQNKDKWIVCWLGLIHGTLSRRNAVQGLKAAHSRELPTAPAAATLAMSPLQ